MAIDNRPKRLGSRHASAGTKKWVAVSSSPAQRATFRDVCAVREFRALWFSQILSAGGDRLALVALALLIYDRTRSPLLAAIAYAAGTLPYLIGALFLSGIADRFPRREVMVTCDVVRAALLILVAAIAFAALARSGTVRISAANNPATTVNPHSLSTKVTAKDGEKGRTRGSRSAAAEPPAITRAEAERVLATYWQQNNIANKLRSDALLATIEAGSSYQMDTGTYRMDRATDPANNDYSPLEAEDAVYYIPREPSSVYPHWFVVRVRYADLASPWHATGAGYVLFTQAAKGAAWKNVLEPYLLTGSSPAPFVQTDAEGYAIETSLTENDPNLNVPPGQIQEATAASLEGAADTVKNPGNLADLQDQASFRPRLPDGSADTDKHYVSGPVFGLKTVGGGALMFYGLTARLSLAPPPGGTFELGIPGYYSQLSLARARCSGAWQSPSR